MGIMGFTTETNLKALCDVTKLYTDGTFKSCAKNFLQLFTKTFLREKMISFTNGDLTQLNVVKEVSYKFIP